MNINKKRHELLSILSQRLVNIDIKVSNNLAIGISFAELASSLNCTQEYLRKIASRLFEEKEIDLYDVKFKGLFCTEKGLASFLDKKYLYLQETKIFDRFKNWIQVLIPVLSLLFTIIIFTKSESKLRKVDIEIQKLKQDLDIIKNSKDSTSIQTDRHR
jgi:hypothetical protein